MLLVGRYRVFEALDARHESSARPILISLNFAVISLSRLDVAVGLDVESMMICGSITPLKPMYVCVFFLFSPCWPSGSILCVTYSQSTLQRDGVF